MVIKNKKKDFKKEFIEFREEFIKVFLPQQIVKLGLYKEYTKDPKKALGKIIKYINKNKEFINSEDWMVIIKDYNEEIKIGKEIISRRYKKEEKEIFYEMAFIYFFSWIEGIIHHHLSEELEIKKISPKESKKFLDGLRFGDKFGIILKILVGKDMIKESIYGDICRLKKRRDFLIHYKPVPGSIIKKFPSIEKEDLERVIVLSEKLLSLIGEYRSKKNSRRHKEMEGILKQLEKSKKK